MEPEGFTIPFLELNDPIKAFQSRFIETLFNSNLILKILIRDVW
jgi:hypothetical protein